MDDKKVTHSEQLRLRRAMYLRGFALAVSYPPNHFGTGAHRKQTKHELAMIPERPQRSQPPDNPDPPESVAKPWKKPWDK